jgi:hypothetical protein
MNLYDLYWIRTAGFPFNKIKGLSVATNDINGEDEYRDLILEKRKILFELISDSLFLEAVYTSSPDSYLRIKSLINKGSKLQINGRNRQHLRMAWSYIQRFYTKNDTVSFFGPLSWSEFSNNIDYVSIKKKKESPNWLLERKFFFEHWIIQCIADKVSNDIFFKDLIPLSLDNSILLKEDSLVFSNGLIKGLNEMQLHTIQLIDRGYNKKDIEKKLKNNFDGALINDFIELLESKKIVNSKILVPTVLKKPEVWLINYLKEIRSGQKDNKWIKVIDNLIKIQDKLQRSQNLENKIDTMKELESYIDENLGDFEKRQKGGMYIGKFFVYEDCLRNFELIIGREIKNKITKSTLPLFNVFRTLANSINKELHDHYLKIFNNEGNEKLSIEKTFAIISKENERIYTDIISKYKDIISSFWKIQVSADEVLMLKSTDFDLLLDKIKNANIHFEEDCFGANFHSIDFFLAATSYDGIKNGDYEIIIGEIHPSVFLVSQPVAYPFCPQSEKMKEDVNNLLKPYKMICVDHPSTYQRSNMNWLDVDNLYEITPSNQSSRVSSANTLKTKDLKILEQNQKLIVEEQLNGRIEDYATVFPHLFNKIMFELSSVVLGGELENEIYLEDILIKRKSWRIDEEICVELAKLTLPTENLDNFNKIDSWRKSKNISQYTFVKIEKEIKPIFVDFKNPFSLDLMIKKLNDKKFFTISEMRPHPSELFCADERGSFLFEVRANLYK